ncbi:MAG: laccase domain-containing protein [Bacteroidales bacterium]|nr:laccase domain-containing protein [Bacteroidales bacterium]
MTSDSTLLQYDLGPGAEACSTRRESVLPFPVVQAHQVHGFRVAVVDRPDITRDALGDYDALVTGVPGCAVGVHTADCVPILIYNPVRRVVAAVHSGWKGTVQRISQKVLFVMKQEFGSRPEELRVAIGPAIGPDSFQVGEEVVQFFKEQGFPLEEIWHFRPGRSGIPMADGHHIDLFKANRWLLEEAGVPASAISVCGIDSYTDPSFFSARREGLSCGRTISCIRLI